MLRYSARTSARYVSLGLSALATLGAGLGCSSESEGQAPYCAPTDPTCTPVNPTGAPVQPIPGQPTVVAPGPTGGVNPQPTGVQPTGPGPIGTQPVTPPVGTSGGVAPVPGPDTGVNPQPTDPGPGVNPGPTPPAPVPANNRTCPAYEGLVADFEEAGENALRTVEAEGRIGLVVPNNDGSQTQVVEVVTEGAEECNNKVLHTTGSGFNVWGAGLETVFSGAWDAAEEGFTPSAYDAAALGYDGIAFRAKKGPGQVNPVKFSVSVPGTRETSLGGDGTCLPGGDDPEGLSTCWNHPGHFLIDDEELSTEWRTYTFCLNGDMYPTSLPFVLSPEQRANVATSLMTLGFEFNKPDGDDPAKKEASFDFYVDDIRLVKNACNAAAGVFQSSAGTAVPFGSNSKVGSCDPIPNAADYNRAISEAYNRWKQKFVAADGGVVDPEEGNRVVSEAIGYGMLITAAMGDKETFDKIWGWGKRFTNDPPTTLLGWLNGGNNSATDADTDMAYALLMAAKQWGGNYTAAGNALAQLAAQRDTQNNVLVAGEQFKTAVNPSYYSPGFYRAFSGWDTITTATKGVLDTCSQGFGGLLPDWCNLSGQPVGAAQTGAQVTAATVCESANTPCLAYDGARVPWRLGFDVCMGGSTKGLLESFINKLKSGDPDVKNGARMDLITAGWNSTGPNADGSPSAMAFLGPVSVGAWALGDAVARDRAFRATLDAMERPEYYETYYQTTVGLLSVLMVTGNWPTP